MIRRPPRSTLDRSSAASDVYKRQAMEWIELTGKTIDEARDLALEKLGVHESEAEVEVLSLIHISEPTRPY